MWEKELKLVQDRIAKLARSLEHVRKEGLERIVKLQNRFEEGKKTDEEKLKEIEKRLKSVEQGSIVGGEETAMRVEEIVGRKLAKQD